ncbi:MAG: hypothetical protein PHC51_14520 [bacterium]|nr:hypothetical protein [bacterium]
MISCKDVAGEVLRADGPLPFRRRLSLAFHFLLCSGCRDFRRQVGSLGTVVRHLIQREQKLSDQELGQIIERVKGE